MIKQFLLLTLIFTLSSALEIVQKPISFSEHRQALTIQYIQKHYDLDVKEITIIPKIIVVHYTAINTLEGSFNAFNRETLPQSRSDIASKKESANVSVAYLVDKDGTIYQLMPDNWMGRHVIGLNYNSIGIENVGTLHHLTDKQLQANIQLIKHLQKKYRSITYLTPHSDYRCFESSVLWLEKDKGYRTHKEDPGKEFMDGLYKAIPSLKKAPCL